MRLFFFCAFNALLLFSYVSAQPYFERRYGSTSNDEAYAIENTADGGFIITGRSQARIATDFDIFILKLDGNGNQVWFRTIANTGDDLGRGIVQMPDLGYIVAGEIAVAGGLDYTLAKFDQFGNFLWQNTYHGYNNDRPSFLSITNDGGLMLTGYGEIASGSGVDCFVLKTDAAGVLQWARGFDGTSNESFYGFTEVSDGYILAGYTQSYGGGASAGIISKIDNNGALVWTDIKGATTGYNGFFMTKAFGANIYSVRETENALIGGRDVWVYKYTVSATASTSVWSMAYGTSRFDEAYSIAHDPSGNFAVAGLTNTTTAGNNSLLFSCDDQGVVRWSTSFGGNGDERFIDVKAVGANGFIACGYTSSSGAGGTDIYVVRVDNNGNATNSSCVKASASLISVVYSPNLTTASPTITSYINSNPLLYTTSLPVITESDVCISLPVTFVSFDAIHKMNASQLTWTTALEINSSRFIIERSENGIDYSPIGEVMAANRNQGSVYYYTDYNTEAKGYYYRLKLLDFDGSAMFSSIRYVTDIALSKGFSFYPNPAHKTLTVKFNVKKEQNVSTASVKIYSLCNLELLSMTATREQLENGISLALDGISPGVYVMKIICADSEYAEKLVVE